MMDDPTRGIDVGAKSEIFELMSKLVIEGYGILFVSSELKEILAMSDHIIVMSKGAITGELPMRKLQTKSLSWRQLFAINRQPEVTIMEKISMTDKGITPENAKKHPVRRADLRQLILRCCAFIALILVIVVFALISPTYLSPQNVEIMSKHVAIWAILAIGQTFVILTGRASILELVRSSV